MVSGIVTSLKLEHLENVPPGIVSNDEGISIFSKPELEKTFPPMDITELGIFIVFRDVHNSKAESLILVIEFGIVISLSDVQFLNADSPMLLIFMD